MFPWIPSHHLTGHRVSTTAWERKPTISLLRVFQCDCPAANHQELPVEAFTLAQVHTAQRDSRDNEIVANSEAAL